MKKQFRLSAILTCLMTFVFGIAVTAQSSAHMSSLTTSSITNRTQSIPTVSAAITGRAQLMQEKLLRTDLEELSFLLSSQSSIDDADFLNLWAAKTRNNLPKTVGILDITHASASCPKGCENDFPDTYLRIDAKMPRHTTKDMPPQTLFDYVTANFAADYCKTDARKRNLIVRFIIDDMNGARAANTGIEPADCTDRIGTGRAQDFFLQDLVTDTPSTAGITPSQLEDQYWNLIKDSTNSALFDQYLGEYPNGKYRDQARQKMGFSPRSKTTVSKTDVQYLIDWTSEVNVGLPEKISNFELTEARSQCAEGCDRKPDAGARNELALVFKTDYWNSTHDFTLEIVPDLKPYLQPEYCSNEGMKRGINLVVFVLDSNDRQLNNFFITPRDCDSAQTSKSKFPANYKLVFSTSEKYKGDFGGLSGANRICQNHASDGGLQGTYIAWLSDGANSPRTTFSRTAFPYVLTDGTQVASNYQALFKGTLDSSINLDEYGNSNKASVWTGTYVDGRAGATNCKRWTNSEYGEAGTEGTTTYNDSNWTHIGEYNCSQPLALFCFQQ